MKVVFWIFADSYEYLTGKLILSGEIREDIGVELGKTILAIKI